MNKFSSSGIYKQERQCKS